MVNHPNRGQHQRGTPIPTSDHQMIAETFPETQRLLQEVAIALRDAGTAGASLGSLMQIGADRNYHRYTQFLICALNIFRETGDSRHRCRRPRRDHPPRRP
jgi:hypothetical protein